MHKIYQTLIKNDTNNKTGDNDSIVVENEEGIEGNLDSKQEEDESPEDWIEVVTCRRKKKASQANVLILMHG